MNGIVSYPSIGSVYQNIQTFDTMATISTIYIPKSYEFEFDLFDDDPITVEEEKDLKLSQLDIELGNVVKLPKGSTSDDLLRSLKS